MQQGVIKLSKNAEKEHLENIRRIEIEQRKADFHLKNEAIKQNNLIKAIELAGLFPHHTKTGAELWGLVEKLENMLAIKPIEFNEPPKQLDLV